MPTDTTVDLDYQLLKLDHALFRLLDTRAQIVAQKPRATEVAREHILAHHSGTLSAREIKKICDALDAVFSKDSLEER